MEKIQIKLGIIGTGKISTQLLYCFAKNPDIETISVLSRSQEKAISFCNDFNIPNPCSKIDDFIKSGINACYVASITSAHYEQLYKLLSSKIHVICEKPIVLNSRKLKTLLEIAKKNQLILFQAYKTKYISLFNDLKKFVDFIKPNKIDFKISKNINLKNSINFKEFADLYFYPIMLVTTLFGEPKNIIDIEKKYNDSSMCFNLIIKYVCKENININIYADGSIDENKLSYIYGKNGYLTIDNTTTLKIIKLYDNDNNLIKHKELLLKYEEYFCFEIQEFVRIFAKNDLITSKINNKLDLITTEIIEKIKTHK